MALAVLARRVRSDRSASGAVTKYCQCDLLSDDVKCKYWAAPCYPSAGRRFAGHDGTHPLVKSDRGRVRHDLDPGQSVCLRRDDQVRKEPRPQACSLHIIAHEEEVEFGFGR